MIIISCWKFCVFIVYKSGICWQERYPHHQNIQIMQDSMLCMQQLLSEVLSAYSTSWSDKTIEKPQVQWCNSIDGTVCWQVARITGHPLRWWCYETRGFWKGNNYEISNQGFFQLLSTGILGLEWKDKTVVFLYRGTINLENFFTKNKLLWEGIITEKCGTEWDQVLATIYSGSIGDSIPRHTHQVGRRILCNNTQKFHSWKHSY